MHNIIGTIIGGDEPKNIIFEITENRRNRFIDDGITISFRIYHYLEKQEAINYLRETLELLKIDWLWYRNGKWFINLDHIRNEMGSSLSAKIKEIDSHRNTIILEPIKRKPYLSLDLLIGNAVCYPTINTDEVEGFDSYETRIDFILTTEYLMELVPKKIFLSHKGIDKPKVREFKITLQTLGFDPWLDEDAMPAGTQLERGLLQGFKDSCAAIFFITPNYKDEKYLGTEVDYAITQKREKQERFSIITLVFDEGKGDCIVPELLKQYVWKTPKTDLEAIREIINALPIKAASMEFKTH